MAHPATLDFVYRVTWPYARSLQASVATDLKTHAAGSVLCEWFQFPNFQKPRLKAAKRRKYVAHQATYPGGLGQCWPSLSFFGSAGLTGGSVADPCCCLL